MPVLGPPQVEPSAPADQRDVTALVGLVMLAVTLSMLLFIAGAPMVALAIPAVIPAALICARWPVPAIVVLLLCTGAYGSLQALTPLPALKLGDALLGALWLGVAVAYARGDRNRPVFPTPGLLLVFAYLAISLLWLVTAASPSAAFESFRLTAVHLSLVAVIAVAPWTPATYRALAKGILGVTAAIGAYCLFRYLTGSAGAEQELARTTVAGLPSSEELRFFGTFPSAQELTAWAAGVLPFSLALMLAWRGRWCWVAAAGILLTALALFASDVRTGMVAAGAGLVVTMALYLGARAFPSGTRVGTGFVAFFLVLAVAGGAYLTTIAGSETREDRFSALLDPGDDRNYQIRTERWELAWEEVKREPLGHGLGSAGTGSRNDEVLPVGPTVLDSSYLKIGIEQGLPMMIFFGLMLLALLASLAWRSLVEPRSGSAAITLGAAGTLTALIVLFYGSSYVESPSIVPAWVIVGAGAAQVAGARSLPGTPRLTGSRA